MPGHQGDWSLGTNQVKVYAQNLHPILCVPSQLSAQSLTEPRGGIRRPELLEKTGWCLHCRNTIAAEKATWKAVNSECLREGWRLILGILAGVGGNKELD